MFKIVVMFLLMQGQIPDALTLPQIHQQGKNYVLENDPGGLVASYEYTFDQLQDTKIIIKGYCISACTLVLMNHNICADGKVQFGFHAPFLMNNDGDIKEASKAIVETILTQYPKSVQKQIKANGGLQKKLLFLTGDQLGVPRC